MKNIKTILMTILLLAFSCTSFAWFSQPEVVGVFNFDTNRDTGFHFEKGTMNVGSQHYSRAHKKYTNGYSKGVATFDNGNLCLYYNAPAGFNRCEIGEENNTIASEMNHNTIYKIVNEKNRVFYVMTIIEGNRDEFILFGKLPNGKYVTYVDSRKICVPYLGTYMVNYYEAGSTGNAITVAFRIFTKEGPKKGRFVFPWSESAQWFGVDVAYD